MSGSDTVSKIRNAEAKLSDEELTRMAIEELNREIVKAKARSEVSPFGNTAVCPLKKANKRFLNTTITNALNFNKRKGFSTRIRSMKKLVDLTDRTANPEAASKPMKFGDRKHIFDKKKKKSKDKQTESTNNEKIIILD